MNGNLTMAHDLLQDLRYFTHIKHLWLNYYTLANVDYKHDIPKRVRESIDHHAKKVRY